MERISSAKNAKIQLIKSLYSAKGRQEHGAFLAEGEHLVEEACRHCEVLFVAVNENKAEKYEHLLAGQHALYIESRLFDSISETVSPQGICAVCKMIPVKSMRKRLIVLNEVQDPGNVGTIIRTADAAGFDVLLDKGCADIYNPKTVRSAMGSMFHISCQKTEDLTQDIERLKQNGYAVYGAVLGGEDFYARQKDSEQLAIIIGNEGKGIAENVQKLCTHCFVLPMYGMAESLNAGVAAAIMMYDVIRQEKE